MILYDSNQYLSSFVCNLEKEKFDYFNLDSNLCHLMNYQNLNKENKRLRKKNWGEHGVRTHNLCLVDRRLNPLSHSYHILKMRYFYVYKALVGTNLAPAGRGHFELLRSPRTRNGSGSFRTWQFAPPDNMGWKSRCQSLSRSCQILQTPTS